MGCCCSSNGIVPIDQASLKFYETIGLNQTDLNKLYSIYSQINHQHVFSQEDWMKWVGSKPTPVSKQHWPLCGLLFDHMNEQTFLYKQKGMENEITMQRFVIVLWDVLTMGRTELSEYVFDTYKARCYDLLLARGEAKQPPEVVAAAEAEAALVAEEAAALKKAEEAAAKLAAETGEELVPVPKPPHRHHAPISDNHNDMTGTELCEVIRDIFTASDDASIQSMVSAVEDMCDGDLSRFIKKKAFVTKCADDGIPSLEPPELEKKQEVENNNKNIENHSKGGGLLWPWLSLVQELRTKTVGEEFWRDQTLRASTSKLVAGSTNIRHRLVHWILRPLGNGLPNPNTKYDDHPGHSMDGPNRGAGAEHTHVHHTPHEQHQQHKHHHRHHHEGHSYPEATTTKKKKEKDHDHAGEHHQHHHHHHQRDNVIGGSSSNDSNGSAVELIETEGQSQQQPPKPKPPPATDNLTSVDEKRAHHHHGHRHHKEATSDSTSSADNVVVSANNNIGVNEKQDEETRAAETAEVESVMKLEDA